MTDTAGTVEERIRQLRAGATPTQDERGLAAQLDTGMRLRGEDLALAMQVSHILSSDPTYTTAVAAYERTLDGTPNTDAVASRALSGDPVSQDEMSAAIDADHRRRDVARLRLEATAARLRIPVARIDPSRVFNFDQAPKAAPRSRRERHVARATSSSDSGDSDPSDLPALARLVRAIRRSLRRAQ